MSQLGDFDRVRLLFLAGELDALWLRHNQERALSLGNKLDAKVKDLTRQDCYAVVEQCYELFRGVFVGTEVLPLFEAYLVSMRRHRVVSVARLDWLIRWGGVWDRNYYRGNYAYDCLWTAYHKYLKSEKEKQSV